MSNNRLEDHDKPTAAALTMPQKVTWQLVAAVDQRTKQMKLVVVGRKQPDLKRFVRSRVIDAGLKAKLPACWAN